MEYAGFWRRSAAMGIDGFLLGFIQAIVNIIMIASIGVAGEGDEGAAVGIVGVVTLLTFVGMWLYFALMESSAKQATLGKMLVGIVVTDTNGNRVTFGKASGRFFGKIASSILLMIGYLMAAFTERKQALHDIMSGCLVIRKPAST